MKIYFRQGSSVLDLSIGNNQSELNRIADSLSTSYTDSIYQLQHIIVIGGASPEGSIQLNKKLSEKRANVLFDYLSQYGTLHDSSKEFIYLGRDWKGLLKLVQADDNVPFQNEAIELIQEIIHQHENNTKNPNDGYNRLLNLREGKPYSYMYRKLFPELRASLVILSYNKTENPIYIKPRPQLTYTAHSMKIPNIIPLFKDFKPISIEHNPSSRSLCMAVKTNMLSDVLLMPNLGIEFYLNNQYSIALNWTYAWWKNDERKWYWRNYGGDIAFRKWLGRKAKDMPLTGHHLGTYAQVITYDILLNEKGYMAGEPGGDIFDRANYAIGLEYGYSLPIASRFNIDFSIGIGYMWGKYYKYTPEDDCYVWQATKNRKYIGPTKAEISLVWLIRQDNIKFMKGGKR